MYPCKKELVTISLDFGVKYPLSVFFKQRGLAGKKHLGIDIAPLKKEDDIYIVAPVGGTIINVSWHEQYGWQVRIKSKESDEDYIHLLAHLEKKAYIKYGQTVHKGELLGLMGSSGSSTAKHLHYEVRLPGTLNRIDPKVYLT
jgi:murein DD-endopeptidase MepM/ murein hydrolase activator NlpD